MFQSLNVNERERKLTKNKKEERKVLNSHILAAQKIDLCINELILKSKVHCKWFCSLTMLEKADRSLRFFFICFDFKFLDRLEGVLELKIHLLRFIVCY